MKRRNPRMKIANEKNSINQNLFHDWINNREITFSDTINSNIDGYISISINQDSLHDWIINCEIIFSDTINQNIDNYVSISINQISFHGWINNRGIIFFDPTSHSELVNQKNAVIFDFQNDVEKSILNHFRNTVFWYENWKKKNSTNEIEIKYFMRK